MHDLSPGTSSCEIDVEQCSLPGRERKINVLALGTLVSQNTVV